MLCMQPLVCQLPPPGTARERARAAAAPCQTRLQRVKPLIAAPPRRTAVYNALSHSISLPMSAEYALAMTTPGAVRSSFESEYAAALQTQLGLDASVSSVSFGAAAAERRRMQNDEVVINYVVQCGAGGCLQAKAKLDNMSTKQMSNIIQAIDDHAFKTGFGTSAVSPASEQLYPTLRRPSPNSRLPHDQPQSSDRGFPAPARHAR